jgi:hypothetical protein
MSAPGSMVRTLRLTTQGLAACGYGRTVSANRHEQYIRLRLFGFTRQQACALVDNGYGFIGGTS